MSTTYQIAEVAHRSGFSPTTLRYYEYIGLVSPAARTEAGYRLYDDSSLRRLRFIARAKQLGCSLDEIAELATVWEGGRCRHVQDRLGATVADKITASQRQVAELTALVADLRRASAALSANTADGPCDEACGCTSEPAASSSTVAPVPRDVAGGMTTPSDAVAGTGTCGDGCGCSSGSGGQEATDEPEVACTLDAAQLASRVEEWSAVLAGVTHRRAMDDGVRLEFGPTTDAMELVRLAAAEQACCSFFRFDLSLDARGIALEVRAPADAAEVVTALFGAAP